jgi:hypothetical protein
VAISSSDVAVEEILERVLDDPDLRPAHWLSGGLRVRPSDRPGTRRTRLLVTATALSSSPVRLSSEWRPTPL